MVTDKRFLTSERQNDFDESALQTYADILAVSLENERLQKDAAVFQLFCEIGHDLSRSLGAISSLISCLDYEIKRAPHVEMIFWNSKAGDYLKRMLQKKNDLKSSQGMCEASDRLSHLILIG